MLHDVRPYSDDWQAFLEDLKYGRQFSVLVAPAFYLNYPEDYRHIFGYLKSLGAKDFYAVSFGADITVWGYLNYIANNDAKGKIAQPCPNIVSYIEKHQPELLPNLIPIQSPLICTAIYLKRYKGIKENLVFLSPCFAKKTEIESKRGLGLVEHNITFKTLMNHIREHNVDIGSYPAIDEVNEYGMGSLFPKPSGLKENMEYYLGPEASVIQVEGGQRAYEYLERFASRVNEQATSMPALISILNCDRGCSHGTGTEFHETEGNDDIYYQAILMRKKKYNTMKDENQKALLNHADRYKRLNEIFKDLRLEDFMCEYETVNTLNTSTAPDSKIDTILNELKEAQQREQEMRKRIQIMFDATPLLIEYWDEDYNCTDCNQTTLDFFQSPGVEEYKEKRLAQMPEFQPNGKPSQEQWAFHLEKIYKEGFSRFDWQENRPDGKPAFLEVLGVCVKYDKRHLLVTYSNDVTKLKQTLIRMREADERTKLMLNGTPIACFLISEYFQAIDCNNETLKLFDFTDKGEGIVKFRQVFSFSGERFAEVKMRFDKALEVGKERFEWDLQKPCNGEILPCDITFLRFRHRGENVVAAYIFDLRVLKEMVKERQRVELAEEGSRAKTRFLARMSHEIRTPLTAVLGISEIQLQDPKLLPHTEEAFAKIHSSASTLLGIVNDILDLSKIETGKLSLVNKKYHMASLINDVVQLHLIYLRSKRLKFNIQVDDQLPAFLVGDELRIKQILNNLLSNALKYTENGSVDLSIRHQKSPEKDHVVLVIDISDTGMGMTQNQIDALYDEYTRFHEQEKRHIDGTGLGMSIVYSLVQLMDGEIDVESGIGKGTTVIVHIPQKIEGSELLGEEAAHNLQLLKPRMGSTADRLKLVPESMPYGKVLVVDDVDVNLYVAKGLLMFYDLQIDTCDNGYDAIKKIRQGNVYDIIFMDQMMPDLDGTETTEILRGMGYKKPIVALTADALIGQKEEYLQKGFDGFVSKPIQTMHLDAALNKFIRDKQPPEVLKAAREAKANGIAPSPSQPREGDINGYMDRQEVADKLRSDFARDQKNVFSDISEALSIGNAKTAHRLAHTLKGLAATIKETSLAKVSGELEKLLMQEGEGTGEAVEQKMSTLEKELALVFDKIEMQMPKGSAAAYGKALPEMDKTKELLDRLAESLLVDSAETLDLIEDLRDIPEAAALIRQIEDFDFDQASKTLVILREILEA